MNQYDPDKILRLKRARLYTELMRNEAFLEYRKNLEEAMDLKGKDVLMPLANLLQVTKAEYDKGTLNGLQLAYDLVPLHIAAVKDEREFQPGFEGTTEEPTEDLPNDD